MPCPRCCRIPSSRSPPRLRSRRRRRARSPYPSRRRTTSCRRDSGSIRWEYPDPSRTFDARRIPTRCTRTKGDDCCRWDIPPVPFSNTIRNRPSLPLPYRRPDWRRRVRDGPDGRPFPRALPVDRDSMISRDIDARTPRNDPCSRDREAAENRNGPIDLRLRCRLRRFDRRRNRTPNTPSRTRYRSPGRGSGRCTTEIRGACRSVRNSIRPRRRRTVLPVDSPRCLWRGRDRCRIGWDP
mmetsp:Transcript_19246/g.56081  ORF Transcript_19246/g.56081 Transcript_19246/m.56081 type:complete len:239 (-) Transcript_19246:424-1140(-)